MLRLFLENLPEAFDVEQGEILGLHHLTEELGILCRCVIIDPICDLDFIQITMGN